MVRPLLISAGSRGDFEPILALAESRDLESPVLFIQRDYKSLAPNAEELPFTMAEMMPSFFYAMQHAAPGERGFETMWRAMGNVVKKFIIPSVDEVLKVAEKANIDVVVSTTLTWMVGHIVAEKVGVPLVLLTFQPDLRSRFLPHACQMPSKAADKFQQLLKGESLVADDENLSTYRHLHDIAYTEFLETLNETRTRLGLSTIDEQSAADIVDGCAEVPSLVACSPQLTPAPADWNHPNMVVGSLASSFRPKDYNPKKAHPELNRFLEDGPRPVVVSYGSLGGNVDGKTLTKTVLTGLRDADVERVVLIPGKAGIDASLVDDDVELASWAKNKVFTVHESVQYSYLLPKACLFLNHGGAGSVMASLCAGTPLVITPIAADQPFYAELIPRLGLGAATELGLATLSPDMVTRAVKAALSKNIAANTFAFAMRERNAVSPVKLVARKLTEIVEQASK